MTTATSTSQATTQPRGLEPEPRPTAAGIIARLLRFQATPVLGATVVLFVVAAVVAPQTFTHASLNAIVIPSGILALAAIGQTLVIQQKGIDLSVGGMISLSAITIGVVHSAGGPLGLSFVLIAVLSIIGGLLNGLLVTRVHITPILATLATNSLFIGVVFTLSGGAAFQAPGPLVSVADAQLLGLPMIGWLALVVVVVVALVMSRTVFGRRFTGVGASPAAARASGVVVGRYIVFGYVAASLFGAVAGALLAGYAGQETYDLGATYQLPVIAAVVVGGAVLSGGRGSVVATGIACVLITLVVQLVLTLGAPTSVQLLVQSIVLGIAATLRLLPWRRFTKRFARRAAPATTS